MGITAATRPAAIARLVASTLLGPPAAWVTVLLVAYEMWVGLAGIVPLSYLAWTWLADARALVTGTYRQPRYYPFALAACVAVIALAVGPLAATGRRPFC